MILKIWKPKYTNISKKRIITEFFLITEREFLEKKYLNCKIVYTCDKCRSNESHLTTSHSLFKSEYNNIESQTCRSCRSKISENEIKKSYIPFNILRDNILSENYKLISSENEYMSSDHKSQFKINVICENGHPHHVTWNNWNKGRRCRKCYEEKKYYDAIKYKEGFDLYMFEVSRLTEINYRNNEDIINPNGYNRGIKTYHIDHIYSKYDGFKNNIDPEIISSPINLKMVNSEYNLSKGKRSDISMEELLELYSKFKSKYSPF